MSDEESTHLFTKLIFWLLAALFTVMTIIGGSTATHLISELDSVHAAVISLQIQVNTNQATSNVQREALEFRLDRIEKKLDH